MKKIVFFLCLSFIVQGVHAQSPRKFYRHAKKMVEAQQFEEALLDLNQAINLDSKYKDAYFLRANVYETQKELELAAADFEQLVYLDYKSTENNYNAGRLNYMIGNYEKAAKFLNNAVLLDSENYRALQYKSYTHIKNTEFKDAIVSINRVLDIKESYISYYVRGVANDSLNNKQLAIDDYKRAIELNANYERALYALSKAYLKLNQVDKALEIADSCVVKFPKDFNSYLVRSMIYHQSGDLALAINDLTKVLTLNGENPDFIFTRGLYYFEYNQYQNARADFTQVISKDPGNMDALYWMARAAEELMETDKAIADYKKLKTLLVKQNIDSKRAEDVSHRLFELNRETKPPVLVLDTPMVIGNKHLAIVKGQNFIQLSGKLEDKADIVKFKINDELFELSEGKRFKYNVNLSDTNAIHFMAEDAYGNQMDVVFDLIQMETDKPIAGIITPYAGDNGEIYLNSKGDNLFVEGFVEDESLIKEIYINDVRASFNDKELNPKFTASIDVLNKKSIELRVMDNFDNELITTYTLIREGALLDDDNPMGKTWVVFIENSNYETLSSLEGPRKDVSTIKGALSDYEIHNFIHKIDMSKEDMERFFSIELRDQVKKNNVNSLMIWYAGHGKFRNETAYWIPVDAILDDEFTFYNINSLKTGMQSYSNIITHILVVSDACESDPTFYQAMRASKEKRSCDDENATKFKSSQVFSSAGYELAEDNSQFTKTFAKTLAHNQDACIPIEIIVSAVTEAVKAKQTQQPQFGNIAGLDDENGTFFFIKK